MTHDQCKKWLYYSIMTGKFEFTGKWDGREGEIAGSVDSKDGYRRISVGGETFSASRLAWFWFFGEWPDGQIDHINGDCDDNRWINLRCVTHAENHKNRRMQCNNTTGITGIGKAGKYVGGRQKWVARIMVDGKQIVLYKGPDFDEAVRRRKAAEVKYGYHPNHGKPISGTKEAYA